MNKSHLGTLLVLLLAACNAEKKAAAEVPATVATPKPAQQTVGFSEPWNTTFHLRATENGEILTIGALFSDVSSVNVYDMASGAVVVLDTNLKVIKTIPLASIGRNSYAGDDFVALDSRFIFLNSVDRRLEFFNRESGAHIRSVPLPADLMFGAEKRSHRVLSRLFLDNGKLFVGNEYYLVPFDPALGKRSATAAVTAEQGRRFSLYGAGKTVLLHDTLLTDKLTGKSFRIPATYHPVSGKRFFRISGSLFCVNAGKDVVTIAKVPQ